MQLQCKQNCNGFVQLNVLFHPCTRLTLMPSGRGVICNEGDSVVIME